MSFNLFTNLFLAVQHTVSLLQIPPNDPKSTSFCQSVDKYEHYTVEAIGELLHCFTTDSTEVPHNKNSSAPLYNPSSTNWIQNILWRSIFQALNPGNQVPCRAAEEKKKREGEKYCLSVFGCGSFASVSCCLLITEQTCFSLCPPLKNRERRPWLSTVL